VSLCVFPANSDKTRSRRADSNRLPLLQLRVCLHAFQGVLMHPVFSLIYAVFSTPGERFCPLRTQHLGTPLYQHGRVELRPSLGWFRSPPIQHLFQIILEGALAVGYKSAMCAFDRLPRCVATIHHHPTLSCSLVQQILEVYGQPLLSPPGTCSHHDLPRFHHYHDLPGQYGPAKPMLRSAETLDKIWTPLDRSGPDWETGMDS
jgi:hypothetical protein